MEIRITCIKKDNGYHENPHIAISELGWINDGDNVTGISTRVQIYDWIENGGIAYVLDSTGNKANIVRAVSPKGTKYLKTTTDNTISDNLLSLQECK